MTITGHTRVVCLTAQEKRRETMQARKSDTGCTCHGQPLVLCPEYRPRVWDHMRAKVSIHHSRGLR